MLQVRFVLKNFLVEVVRFVLVQVNDLEAIGQSALLALPEAPLRSCFVQIRHRVSFGSSPPLQLQQDYVNPGLVPAKRAVRLQQLLKNLIVRCKFDVALKLEMRRPELQGILDRLSGKVGGDHKHRPPVSCGSLRAVQQDKGDSRELQVRLARRMDDRNIAKHAIVLSLILRQQPAMAPQRVGKIEVCYLDTFNRLQYESPAPRHHEGCQQLRHRIQQSGAQTVWLVFRTRRGKPPQRLIARPPNRGHTLKSGPVLVAVVPKFFVKTLTADYVMGLRLKGFD